MNGARTIVIGEEGKGVRKGMGKGNGEGRGKEKPRNAERS